MSLKVEKVQSEEENELLTQLRRKIFAEEQGFPSDKAIDELDLNGVAANFIAYLVNIDKNGISVSKPVGLSRWIPTDEGYQIQKVAVLKEYRKYGVGYPITQAILAEAALKDIQQVDPTPSAVVSILTQVQSSRIYEASGFRIIGDEFKICGFPHLIMVLDPNRSRAKTSGITEAEICRVMYDKVEKASFLLENHASTSEMASPVTKNGDHAVVPSFSETGRSLKVPGQGNWRERVVLT